DVAPAQRRNTKREGAPAKRAEAPSCGRRKIAPVGHLVPATRYRPGLTNEWSRSSGTACSGTGGDARHAGAFRRRNTTNFLSFRGALIEAITRFRWSAPRRRGILAA